MPKQGTDPPLSAITFRESVIVPDVDAPGGSRFVLAGTPSPYRSLDEIPVNLRPLVGKPPVEPDEADESSPRSLNFTLNTVYRVDKDGYRRARNLEREVINLQRGQEEMEALEDALSAEPDEQLKAALEVVQEAHEASVARQIAEGQYAAKEQERAQEVAQEFIDEENLEEEPQHDRTRNEKFPT